jgi:hypothetical protein
MPSVATAIDVARLYDELRDCVRANDQEGVKRVFNELVRARRPVTEILDEVRSISKERERSEPERDVTPLREWPPRSPSAEAEPSTPGLTFRNFGPAVDPRPVPEPPDTAGSATNPVPERGPSLDEWSHQNTATELPPRTPEPTPRSPERVADAGNGEAALRLRETYDPNLLERAQLRAVQGDAAAAVFWYRRAREFGVAEAEILLKGIQTK